MASPKIAEGRYGPILYLPNDFYVGGALEKYGEYSEAEIEAFRTFLQPGDNIIEAGSNIGSHTLPLAKIIGPAGSLWAFEPQRFIFQMMCGTLALNGIENVTPLNAAAGSEAGEIGVPAMDYSSVNNFGGVSMADGAADKAKVITIDSLGIDRLKFIKIDVEGMEAEVINGARDTIARTRPIIYCENDRREKSEALIALVDEIGYRAWWHLPAFYNKDNFLKNPKDDFGNMVSINMLCVPKETELKTNLVPASSDHHRELEQ